MKKQSIGFNSNNYFPKSKTEKVLQKWASDEGEIHEEDIRKAASSYAKLEINNRILRYIIVAIVIFLFILLGFMIASVVIGVKITKDVNVRNGALVSASNSNLVLKTSNLKYVSKITYNSPLAVVESLKSLSVKVKENGQTGTFQFDVVSFVYIKGKKLVFNGHTHSASIQGDGTVILTPLIPLEGIGTFTAVDAVTTSVDAATGFHLTDEKDTTIPIDSCITLMGITDAAANYKLTASFNCTLTKMLFAGKIFSGIFDGNGQNLTITYASSMGGSAALMESLSGTIMNLVLEGTVSGTGVCAGFATKAYLGSMISRSASNVKITCKTPSTNSQLAIVGGFVGTIETPDVFSVSASNNVMFFNTISQGKVSAMDKFVVSGGGAAQIGAYFGESNGLTVTFRNSLVDSAIVPETDGDNQNFAIIGFENGKIYTQNSEGELLCVANNNANGTPYDEYCTQIERCPNIPQSLFRAGYNCDPHFCWKCRDTTFERNAVFAYTPVYPNYYTGADACQKL